MDFGKPQAPIKQPPHESNFDSKLDDLKIDLEKEIGEVPQNNIPSPTPPPTPRPPTPPAITQSPLKPVEDKEVHAMDTAMDDELEHKPNIKLIVIIILAVLLVVAGVSAAFWGYQKIFASAPEAILFQAIENTEKMESGTINVRADITVRPPEVGDGGAFAFGGADEFTTTVNIKTDFEPVDDFVKSSTEISLTVPTGVEVPLIGAASFTPVFNIVSVNKDGFYLKIIGLPANPFIDFSNINNKWIYFGFDELKNQGISFDAEGEDGDALEDNYDKILEILKNNFFFDLEKLPDGMVGEESAYYIIGSFNQTNFKAFLIALDEFTQENDIKGLEVADLDNLDEDLKDLKKLDAEFWVTKKDKLPKKTVLTVQIANEKEGEFDVDVEMTFDNFNQPVNIVAPDTFRPFLEVMEELQEEMMSGMMGDPTMVIDAGPGIDITIDSDNDGLPDYFEGIFGTDVFDVDSDGDGYLDGEEAKNHYNPMGSGTIEDNTELIDIEKIRTLYILNDLVANPTMIELADNETVLDLFLAELGEESFGNLMK